MYFIFRDYRVSKDTINKLNYASNILKVHLQLLAQLDNTKDITKLY